MQYEIFVLYLSINLFFKSRPDYIFLRTLRTQWEYKGKVGGSIPIVVEICLLFWGVKYRRNSRLCRVNQRFYHLFH